MKDILQMILKMEMKICIFQMAKVFKENSKMMLFGIRSYDKERRQ